MASLFNTLQTGAFRAGVQARTKKSSQWFERKVKELGDVSPRTVLKDKALDPTTKPQIGDMMMYFYDPKTKATLPYYDRFPLIFSINKAKGGFLGLNLHYLPPILRAKLMDNLYTVLNNKKFDETTRISASYKVLNGAAKFREFQPCVKHYLNAHVRTKPAYIMPSEWDIALFLPTQKFVGATANQVYADSRKIVRGR